ncbi:MAG TPA: tetratricopeptide repeat protein [Polyangiaceae bacterium]
MRSRNVVASFVAVGLVALAPGRASAQEQTEAAATALFDRGRSLMQQGKYAEACPKLAESERLAPSGGTLLNLGECYEHTGQTASAWAAWKDAAARANAAGKADVEKRALARAAALEPNLAKLAISVDSASDVPGLEVKRDGVKVGHAEFGLAIPVDPGTHVIDATAPSKQPFSGKVDVAPKQGNATLTVTLIDAPQTQAAPTPVAAPSPASAPASAPAAAEEPPSTWSGQKTVALVVGGVGVVGIGVGSIFGLMAKSKNDQALQNCRTSTLCSQTGLDLTNDAKSAATVSTIAFIAGGVALAGGIVLWLTAPSSSRPTTGVRFVPLVGTSLGGGALTGSW